MTTATPQLSFSIIINNYNYDRYLRQAIDSALQQTHAQVEVIVVDDGSTDSSRATIESYGDRIKRIYSENNGQGSAYNNGFSASKGDLVCFLDSDDWLHPEAAQAVSSSWRHDFSKVHYPLQLVDESGKTLSCNTPTSRLDDGDLKLQVAKTGYYCSSPGSGNIYSRHFLESVMPVTPIGEWRASADTFLLFQAPFHGSIGSVDRPLGCYRIHGESLSYVPVGDTAATVRKLEKQLQDHERQFAIINTEASRLGISQDLCHRDLSWPHIKLRLALTRLSRTTRFSYPHFWNPAFEGMKKLWSTKSISAPARAIGIAWTVALGLAPSPLLPALVELGIRAKARGPIFNMLTRMRCSKGIRQLK